VKKIFFLIIFVCFTSGYSDSEASDFFIPIETPEYRILYDYLRRIEIEDASARFGGLVTPLSDKDIFKEHIIFGDDRPDHFQMKPYVIVSEDFTSSKYSRANGFESIRGGLMASPSKNFTFYLGLLMDERLAENPDYYGKKWRGLAGEVETGMAIYRNKSVTIIAGRFGSSWGPNRQSLFLSETARPMDAFQFRAGWGRLYYTYQFGKLNRLRSANEDSEGYENRFFVGHRIDIKAGNNFYIGLNETIIYGGLGRSIELAYLNPLMFFHSFQLNENYDDNTFLGLDVTFFVDKRFKFYGQLLVDDFQIDNATRGDNEPNEIGFSLGLHSIDLFDHLDLKAEYFRIANWTYNQKLERNRYDNRGSLIGYESGPDTDKISLALIRWLNTWQNISFNLMYQRRGEGRFDSDWTEPWLDVDNYSESFPTGIVEKKFGAALNFTGYLKPFLYIESRGGVDIVDNFNHIDGAGRTIPFFSAKLSLLFSNNLNIGQ